MTAMAGRTALRWGGATHVGRVRSTNDDNYMARDDIGLWAVADGMGGHRGGDVASAIASEAVGRSFAEHTVDGLVEAIEQANQAVYETAAGDPELTGMGTTMVALAVVDEDGDELLAVANVGDSRVYRYSVGELEQLTDDHSLVADLVREGSLSPEEAAVHPQRNIVTRALGVNDRVPVDILTVEPVAGDRFLLCSDGLFNEVAEPGIAAVLRRVDDPGEAAAELVHLAVDSGGRDNVTVVVVDVVDDGGRAGEASDALAVGAASGLAGRAEPARPRPRTGAPAASPSSPPGLPTAAGLGRPPMRPARHPGVGGSRGGSCCSHSSCWRSSVAPSRPSSGTGGPPTSSASRVTASRSSRDALVASCGSTRCWRRRPTSNGRTFPATRGTTSTPARNSPRSATPTATSTG
jgi:serine/threonine protein phosphatase PrpC